MAHVSNQYSNQMDGLGGSGHMVVQTQSVSFADGSVIHHTNTFESWVTVSAPPPMNMELGPNTSTAPNIFNSLDMGGANTITSRGAETYLAVPALTDTMSRATPSVAVSLQSPFVSANPVEPIVALPAPIAMTEPPLVAAVQNPAETYIALPVPQACDPLVAVSAAQNLYNPIVGNPETTVPIIQTPVSQQTQTSAPSWYLVVQDMPGVAQNSTAEPPSVIRTDDDLFLCRRCNSTFEKASCINWHLRECKGDYMKANVPHGGRTSAAFEAKALQCTLCARIFTVLHQPETTFICSDCSSATLPLAFPLGTQPLPQFKCRLCNDFFQYEAELEDHQSTHRSSVIIRELPDNYDEENDNGECRSSVTICELPDNYDHDEDSVSVINEPTVEAPEDNVKSGLYESASDVVEPTQNFSDCCGECGAIFPCHDSLDQHLKTHDDVRSYGCTRCGTICVGKYSLDRHVWAHGREAEENKNNFSDCCVEEHKKDTKDGCISQPFGCTECGMQFSHSSDLKEHCVSHLGFKPFLCTRCGETFENTSSLERHWEGHTAMMQ